MPELKTVLITGASEGIGRCFAEVFAKRGHDLVLVARNQSRLDDLAASLSAEYAIKAQTFAADLIPPDAPQQLFEQLAEQQI
ncbi:MAG: SDR family NAD(P)-dependent oxidoreductase, partial [Pseudomonadales bacterium]